MAMDGTENEQGGELVEQILNDAVREDEARVNVTFGGFNGDLNDPVSWDASDEAIKEWITEALRTGGVAGIPATPDANLTDFVIDRFEATEARPYRLLQARPKTPFGA